MTDPTADVSCPTCHAGFWVTNPDALPWSSCPDCPEAEWDSWRRDLSLRDALPLLLLVVGVVGFVVGLCVLGVAR